MKHLALIVASGSMAVVAAPAQAAELPVAPAASASLFAGFNPGAPALSPHVAYHDDDWDDDRRRWRRR